MPRVTFIYPCVGRFPETRYVRSWQMQPLAIGVLSALTPPDWERRFFDDRLEPIEFDRPTDLVAISAETFTARRAYQVAAEYRRRGVPVVLGGYHPTSRPGEALEHADAVCVGEAEGVWPRMLEDARAGRLRGLYRAGGTPPDDRDTLCGVCPPQPLLTSRVDRSIFAGKPYFRLALVETSRGCRFACTFCSIAAFHRSGHRRRPVAEIVEEIRGLRERTVFFVDDNIVGEREGARELFDALVPLRIRWISQASLDLARDPELLDLAARSGCRGLLVGFESLDPAALAGLNKSVNAGTDFAAALAAFRARGIVIYGTFIFGLPGDDEARVRETVAFARRHRLFLAAVAHPMPFPGTPLYDRLERDGRLLHPRWWLDADYRFGRPVHRPETMTTPELEAYCHRARRAFYGLPSIAARAADVRANARGPATAAAFWGLNLLMRREIDQKRGLPLGVRTSPDEGLTLHKV